MHALLHHSLAAAPEIFLTIVSTFSVGFLLWFLVGLLREQRRIEAPQVHIFRFTGGHSRRPATLAAPTVAMTQVTRKGGRVQVSSAPDQRSPKNAVTIRWLVMCLLCAATVRLFQTQPQIKHAEQLCLSQDRERTTALL